MTKRNPAGLTAKGERMYEHIKEGYGSDPRAKEIAARTVYARAAEGVRGLRRSHNPDSPDLPAAVAGYEDFHKYTPREIGTFVGLVIPRRIAVVGEMEQTLYRSDKWENRNNEYFHDHEPGVMIGRTDAVEYEYDTSGILEKKIGQRPPTTTAVPAHIANATALYLLGQCIGFSYVDHHGEVVEAQVPSGHELYGVPQRDALLVIDVAGPKAVVKAILWGGNLKITERGIVG